MKCPSCGYFNLPGLEACGACGASLTAREAPENGTPRLAEWGEVLPPRAKNRSTAQKVEHGLGRTGRRGAQAARNAQAGVIAAERATRDGLDAGRQWGHSQLFNSWLMLRWWLTPQHWRAVGREYHALIVAAASVVPGLGQMLQRRRPVALAHFASAVLLAVFALWLFGSLPGRAFGYGLLSLVLFSVWDATMHGLPTPQSERAQGLRPWRAAMFSVMMVALVMAVASAIFNDRVALVYVGIDAGKAIHRGDTLLLRRLEQPLSQLKRGDIIVASGTFADAGFANDNFAIPVCERVIGLPGDRIEGRDGRLWVNGRPLAPAEEPLILGNAPPVFAETVPAHNVALWQATPGNGDGIRYRSLNLVPEDAIAGRVVAICGPPSRRRWLE